MEFLVAAILILIGLTGGVVFLSYTIFWYEAANRNRELMRERFAAKNLGFALMLLCRETFWLVITVLVHPLGWLPEKDKSSEKGTPILLLHGLFHNRSCWWLFKRRLRRAGLGPIYSINLSTLRDVETLTEKMAKKVDQIRLNHHVDRIDVIGHSMGGMIARNYIQIRGGSQKIRSCVTLGAPHFGSRLAPFALTPMGQQLLPGSEFLNRLADAEIPAQVRFSCIFSHHDNLIIPFDSARWEQALNAEVKKIGHSSLLYLARPFKEALSFLREEHHGKPDRQQQAAG